MGKSWSLERNAGWLVMMDRYHSVIKNTLAPRLVIFNVHGGIRDYKFMRYGLASTLMDDGYFCFTDTAKGYSSVPWFDEYDVVLAQVLTRHNLRRGKKEFTGGSSKKAWCL